MRFIMLVVGIFIASFAVAALYDDIHLENATVLANGNLQQGSKLYTYKHEGAGYNAPIIFTSNGSTVARFGTSATVGSKDRAELIVSQGVQHYQYYYVGFEFYIPYNSTTYPYPTNWFMFTQFRQNGTTTQSPSLSLGLDGDRLIVVGRNDHDPYEVLIERDMSGLFNQWINLILRVRLDDNGEVTVWFNGEQPETVMHDLRYDCAGCLTASTLRFGVYRGAHSTPYFINFDDFRLGQYYSDVKSW